MISHEELQKRLISIRALIVDCDGVMTGGELIYTAAGDDLHVFNVRDGHGLVMAREAGIFLGMITGRASAAVRRRIQELKFHAYIEGCKDKAAALRELCAENHFTPDQICYMGDDINDIDVMRLAGLGVAVADSEQAVLAAADWITQKPGGRGAVREMCDALLLTHLSHSKVHIF